MADGLRTILAHAVLIGKPDSYDCSPSNYFRVLQDYLQISELHPAQPDPGRAGAGGRVRGGS